MKICPKCGYQKTKNDDIYPDHECPKCGVIYAKANQEYQSPKKTNNNSTNESSSEKLYHNKNSFFEKWKTSYHKWKPSFQKQEASFQKQIDMAKAKASKNVGLCPRCKSNRTGQIDGTSYRIMGVIAIIGGVLLVLIPPLCFLGIGGGLGLLMISSFIKTSYYCQDCKLSWKPGENPFPETNGLGQ
jgi:predicted Zn-ribbon and HTH transcriptional regulator